MFRLILKYSSYLFRSIVFLYVLVAAFYFLKKSAGMGDESVFIGDLKLINTEGWIVAIAKGISIPYLLFSYPFSLFLESSMALRIVNVLLIVVLHMYFYSFRKIKLTDFYFLLLFFYSTVGYFFAGINDTLFIVSLVIFFSETHFILTSVKKEKTILLWCALIISLFTRELFLVYLPVIGLSLFLLFRKKKLRIKRMLFPVLLFVFFLGLNIPSLLQNKSLSYDRKDPPITASANWAQRQYLAQQLVNEGKLQNYQHPGWEETDAYLEANGVNSLPSGIVSGMLFDVKLTLKEFFKDLLYVAIYSTRQLGLVLPVIFVIGFIELFKSRKINALNYIPAITITMISIFSLIIISFIELRWLGAVFIMSILYFSQLVKQKKIPEIVVLLQYAVVTCLSLYGIYGLMGKMS